MTRLSLILRNLRYFAKLHVAVLLGVVAASTVLVGALLVGDSVRGSLHDAAARRLAGIDVIVRAMRPLRAALADELAQDAPLAAQFKTIEPLITQKAVATAPASGRRAGSAALLGLRPALWAALGGKIDDFPAEGQSAISAPLAAEIGVQVGDEIVVHVPEYQAVSSETLLGRRDQSPAARRLRVAAILPDRGLGGFSPAPSQRTPLNVFIPLRTAQSMTGLEERTNSLVFSALRSSMSDQRTKLIAEALRARVRAADLGLHVRFDPQRSLLSAESDALILGRELEVAARETAAALGARSEAALGYLANEIRRTTRATASSPGVPAPEAAASIPYSVVVGIEDEAEFAGDSKRPDEALPPALLNSWTADALHASIGDSIELEYFLTSERGALSTHTAAFRVCGIVPMDGSLADRNFIPEYKGVTDSRRVSDWDPPFPMDLKRIKPRDEAYWEQYRTIPKVYVRLRDAQRLWTEHDSRFGQVTSVRVRLPNGENPSNAVTQFEERWARTAASELRGIQVEDVQARVAQASAGTTDFGGLFIGFSFFLMVSAAMLVALLFRLNMERRAAEVGLLLALGCCPRSVTRILLLEGAAIALVGTLIGSVAAQLYAWLMLAGLRSWWAAATNAPFLELHATAQSYVIGAGLAFCVALGSIAHALRGLTRIAPSRLLAGATGAPAAANRGAASSASSARIRNAFACLALLILAAPLISSAAPASLVFFCAGACALVSGIAACRRLLVDSTQHTRLDPQHAVRTLAWRNAARNPGRSTLTIGLLAAAVFLIVSIGAFRLEPQQDTRALHSGAGGFALIGETSTPILGDLNLPKDREALGLPREPAADFVMMRLRDGDAGSCLNLYQRSTPRIVGARPAELTGRFSFAAASRQGVGANDSPWSLLEQAQPDGAVPAIGDEAAVRWQFHKDVGDTFAIVDESGTQVLLRFVALLASSVLQDELLISEANFKRLFPSVAGYGFFLISPHGEDVPGTAALLEKSLGEYGMDVTYSVDRLAAYFGVQNTYLSTFQTLGGLGLVLGSLGMVAVLLRSVLERRRELALHLALGFGRARLTKIILLENLALAACGIVCGLIPALLAILPAAITRPAGMPWLDISATLLGIVVVLTPIAWLAARATLAQPLVLSLRAA